MSDRGRITAFLSCVLLLAIVGVATSRFVASSMLRTDAQNTVIEWVKTLRQSTDELPALLVGVQPSAQGQEVLHRSVLVGEVYRFRLWSMHGDLLYADERIPTVEHFDSPMTCCNELILRRLRSGLPFTRLVSNVTREEVRDFADVMVPMRDDSGQVVAILEVFFSEEVDLPFYQRYFLLSEAVMGLVVLLAGGVPVWGIYRRMKAHREAEARALYLANHDSLTGVANRARLAESARVVLSWSRRNQQRAAVLLLDLDRFKEINDGFGHAAGDKLLQQFSRRIVTAVRTEDLVARLGGDEFVILQVGIDKPSDAADLAERLLAVLAQPYEIGGAKLSCHSSIGVAITPDDATEWDALLSCADAALYKAKAEGRNTVCYYKAGMDAILHRRRRIEGDLRRALQNELFELAYQPIYSFHDQDLLGFEALLRWPSTWPPLSPDDFIPVAEECGLILPIGAWVLNAACQTAASWALPLKVSVNLSPAQFRQGNIVATVESALLRSGLPAGQLELEVTESLWLQNTDAVLEQLDALRAMGVTIALDDFGIGYSSLSYLWKFSFDRVKIDRSFVMEMEQDAKAAAIVHSIVSLGRSLNLTVTAEGVENRAQANALSAAGCDQVQGYYFSRPLSTSAANELVLRSRHESEPPKAG